MTPNKKHLKYALALGLPFLLAAKSDSPALAAIKEQATAVAPLVQSQLAKDWLAGVNELVDPSVRTIYRNGPAFITKEQYDALPADVKTKAKTRDVDSQLYYNTKYGTPVAYARVADLAAQFGVTTFNGAKIMDFGYGGIGQLRIFASQGATAVGVDVDPFLPAIYNQSEDSGKYSKGTVQMVDGQFPASDKVNAAVGGDFDLIISKNTLKHGYVHPAKPVDKRMLVDLRVSDEKFLQMTHDALKPGGILLIYNLCPAMAPDDKPYIPWADGHSPFTQDQYEKAGFKVLAFDTVDDEMARKFGHAFGWDQQGMKLDTDLFAWYTVVQRS